ncbi:UNVERIFIED_CONTAM: hypothetical protein FKN15_049079 [Acipenser sinensis]
MVADMTSFEDMKKLEASGDISPSEQKDHVESEASTEESSEDEDSDHESDMKFGVLHIKDNAPVIESSSDHSTSHIKWNVTSLSPVGPIVQTSQRIEHHGVVLVYKVLDNHPSASFRVYLATNNNSDVKVIGIQAILKKQVSREQKMDIYKDVKQSNKKYIKMDKPPTCQKLLEEKKKYRLISEPEADITPEEIQFTLHAVRFKGYFEVYFEQPVSFKLSLVEADSDLTVWTTTLRECDWNTSNFKETGVKRAENGIKRKRSSSSEEENDNKKFKCTDTTDGSRSSKNSYITEQQLMRIAKVFGKEWKQLGISYLNISKNDIDQIQEEDKEDLAMQKFNMLLEWKKKAKDNATIKDLYYSLHDPDVPYVVKKLLQDGSRSSKNLYITEQQLMRIAKVFGKEWKQLGISYLNISKNDIDQIQEEDKEDLAMQKFNMLLEWKKKAKDNATIKDLYYSLHDPDVPYVVKKLLQGFV